ncbi:MAG: signal peptidase II [Syntrophobacteraceae bacterium]
MARKKRILMVFLTLVISMGCDQITKYLAKEYLPKTRIVSLSGGPLKLHYSENKGASFVFE